MLPNHLIPPLPKPQQQRLLNPQRPHMLIFPPERHLPPARNFHVEIPHHPRDNDAHFQQGDFFADAGAGADGEGLVGGGDEGFLVGIWVGEETFGGEGGGVGEVKGGVVGGVGVEVADSLWEVGVGVSILSLRRRRIWTLG